jgi:hypothetical protein
MQRLIIRPVADPQKAGSFVAWLESTGDFVIRSRQVNGACELRARGFDPATLLTMRHEVGRTTA